MNVFIFYVCVGLVFCGICLDNDVEPDQAFAAALCWPIVLPVLAGIYVTRFIKWSLR